MVLIIGTVLAWIVGYAALCAVQPFAPCKKCAGTGRQLNGRKAKTCRKCRGKKARLRYGRRVHNSWRTTYQAGSK